MAEVLDETEEERLAREAEEALLLAEQEASLLPQTAIPADNVAFTNAVEGQIQIDPPEGFAPTFDRQMIGDERYMQEVARARAGSGFIAGYGDTPTYDPAIAEAAQRREQDKLAAQAERFMGVQGYQQSLKSGAAPAEALALWGQKMFRGDPGGYANLVTRREPVVRSVAHKPQWGKVPAQIADQIRSLDEDEKAQQAVLTRGTVTGSSWSEPLSDEQRAEAKANIGRIRADKQRILANPRYNSNVDTTGIDLNRWENPPARPVLPDAPAKQLAAPVEETITITTKEQFDKIPSGSVYTGKDGKKYRKP